VCCQRCKSTALAMESRHPYVPLFFCATHECTWWCATSPSKTLMCGRAACTLCARIDQCTLRVHSTHIRMVPWLKASHSAVDGWHYRCSCALVFKSTRHKLKQHDHDTPPLLSILQYPPQQGDYPPQQGQYPPQQGQYPPQQGQYPPQQGQYPPQGPPPGAYQQPHYPPQQQYVHLPHPRLPTVKMRRGYPTQCAARVFFHHRNQYSLNQHCVH
jgi:hypothetical protein